jgi:phospholipase D1/2
LAEAREEILILDWWLSPELYLRRPPSLNEQYRVDNMLKAAAERGVKVHIIVYKEVEAALTCNSAVRHFYSMARSWLLTRSPSAYQARP